MKGHFVSHDVSWLASERRFLCEPLPGLATIDNLFTGKLAAIEENASTILRPPLALTCRILHHPTSKVSLASWSLMGRPIADARHDPHKWRSMRTLLNWARWHIEGIALKAH